MPLRFLLRSQTLLIKSALAKQFSSLLFHVEKGNGLFTVKRIEKRLGRLLNKHNECNLFVSNFHTFIYKNVTFVVKISLKKFWYNNSTTYSLHTIMSKLLFQLHNLLYTLYTCKIEKYKWNGGQTSCKSMSRMYLHTYYEIFLYEMKSSIL